MGAVTQFALGFNAVVFAALTLFIFLGRGSRTHSRVLSILTTFSLVIHILAMVASAIYARGIPLGLTVSFLFFIGLGMYLQIQVHVAMGRIRIPTSQALGAALRFSLATLGGFAVYFLTDSLCSVALVAFAGKFHFSEVARELFIWLRPPVSLFVAGWVYRLCEQDLFSFSFGAKPQDQSDLTRRLAHIASSYKVIRRGERVAFFTLPGQELSLACVRAFESPFSFKKRKLTLYISHDIAEHLSERELEFLTLRELVALRMRQPHQALIFSTVFFLLIMLPYVILVQYTLFTLPPVWVLPVWCALYGVLFGLQAMATRLMDQYNEIQRFTIAARFLHWTHAEIVGLYQTLSRLNTSRLDAPILFRLPALPRARYFPSEKTRASIRKKRPWVRIQLAALGLALASVVFGFVVLRPRHLLVEAVAMGDASRVAQFLQKGWNPNQEDIFSNGMTPLLAAVRSTLRPELVLLLEAHADPNRYHPFGISPLLLSAEKGWSTGAKILLEHGANPNFRGYRGFTPVMLAASHGHLEMVQLLFKCGARIDDQSEHGSTALMLAVQAGDAAMVDELLEHRPSIRMRDHDGDDALGLAKQKGWVQIASHLERKLASSHSK